MKLNTLSVPGWAGHVSGRGAPGAGHTRLGPNWIGVSSTPSSVEQSNLSPQTWRRPNQWPISWVVTPPSLYPVMAPPTKHPVLMTQPSASRTVTGPMVVVSGFGSPKRPTPSVFNRLALHLALSSLLTVTTDVAKRSAVKVQIQRIIPSTS